MTIQYVPKNMYTGLMSEYFHCRVVLENVWTELGTRLQKQCRNQSGRDPGRSCPAERFRQYMRFDGHHRISDRFDTYAGRSVGSRRDRTEYGGRFVDRPIWNRLQIPLLFGGKKSQQTTVNQCLKEEKMAYLIAIVVFVLTLFVGVVSVAGPEGILLLWNLPSFLMIVVPTLAVAISSVSLKGANTTRVVFGKQTNTSPVEAKKVFDFFRMLGNASILLGIVAFLVSLVLLLANLSDPNTIGPSMALGLISLLYAACLKLIAFSVEFSVRKKAGLMDDALNSNVGDWIVYVYPIMPMLLFFILLFAMSKSG